MPLSKYYPYFTLFGTISLCILMFYLGNVKWHDIIHSIMIVYTIPLIFLGGMLLVMYYFGDIEQRKHPFLLTAGIFFFGLGAIPTVMLGTSGQLLTVGMSNAETLLFIPPQPQPDYTLFIILLLFKEQVWDIQSANTQYLMIIATLSLAIICFLIYGFLRYGRTQNHRIEKVRLRI